MIRDIILKPISKDDFYREGKVYCKLWDRDILVDIYDEEVTPEYAEKCAEAMNSMSDGLVDAICRAAKRYCLTFLDEICDEWRDEIKSTVHVEEDTPPGEMLKYFEAEAMIVDAPADPSRIGYQLSGNCDWEKEHGIEIDILDGRLVYLGEYCGGSPWEECPAEE